jgi:hypothetical protein
MTRPLRPLCAPLLLCVAALLGCGTREDRTITFSTGGDRVAFQHGREGVFVADKQGGGLTKIFTPDKDVIAVGTPLWAPNDRRLIFTTARALPGTGVAVAPSSEPEPEGRLFGKQPAVYTCWLRDEPKGDTAPEPRELFTSQVADVGYVAAGLAVRWHPSGDRVLYVEQDGASHVVAEFDLTTKKRRRISPDVKAADVVFDWSPDGTHLACVAAGTPGQTDDGIWVRVGEEWWHVAESAQPGGGLEHLKAARPAWGNDGRRFAFVTSLAGKGEGDPAHYSLWSAALEGRRVRRILEETRPLHDLAWHPAGERLGFVAGGEGGTLRVTDLDHDPVDVTDRPVRSFAGWDAAGRFLAYTTAEPLALPDENGLGLLLFADPLARDVLWVAPGAGDAPGRSVVSGLRTSFVRWSPGGERLSQWFTFSPSHQSIFSKGLNWGLRRGDPAATIDPQTGAVSWMAVDADELAQVGHYYLQKREYDTAWSWYERAERGRKPAPGVAPGAGVRPFRDPSLFAYHCLNKLGRGEEARARLAAFREKAPALLPAVDPKSPDPVMREVGTLLPLARDLYAAEVFLSLDAAEDGEAFFRRTLAEATTDDDRLSAAVALSQLVLLRGRTAEYADLATGTIAPLLLRAWQPRKAGDAANQWASQPLPVVVGSLSLFPLARSELLAALPKDRLGALAEKWTALRAQAPDDLSRLGADVVLEGLYRKLGRDTDAAAAHGRITSNPLAGGRLWTEEEIKAAYKELRGALDQMGAPLLLSLRSGVS